MRTIVQTMKFGGPTELIAVCDDGTMWLGNLLRLKDASEPNDLIVEWKPLNGPPDGEPWFKNKSLWDRIEETLRHENQ